MTPLLVEIFRSSNIFIKENILGFIMLKYQPDAGPAANRTKRTRPQSK